MNDVEYSDMPHKLWTLFVLTVLLCVASCIPVTVRNSPDRPVPTAPMGVTQGSDGVNTQLNPQLGGPPQLEDYKGGFNWGKAALDVATGNWTGLAASAVAALAGGYGISQRRRRQREVNELRQDRDELAHDDPEVADMKLAMIKKKESQQ